MKALKDRTITVKKRASDGSWMASTTIDGSAGMQLLAVHVELSKGLVPSVKYVEIHGKNSVGAAVYEKKKA